MNARLGDVRNMLQEALAAGATNEEAGAGFILRTCRRRSGLGFLDLGKVLWDQ
jgi:hypothetical protein